jgi:hypothetical protein
MELNPVTFIGHYDGEKPADLHYTQVRHHLFGSTSVVEK